MHYNDDSLTKRTGLTRETASFSLGAAKIPSVIVIQRLVRSSFGFRGRQQLSLNMAAAKKAEMDHPPYNEMIADAIATLADRGGSSLIAIKKHIGAKYKLKEGWERKASFGALSIDPQSYI